MIKLLLGGTPNTLTLEIHMPAADNVTVQRHDHPLLAWPNMDSSHEAT